MQEHLEGEAVASAKGLRQPHSGGGGVHGVKAEGVQWQQGLRWRSHAVGSRPSGKSLGSLLSSRRDSVWEFGAGGGVVWCRDLRGGRGGSRVLPSSSL